MAYSGVDYYHIDELLSQEERLVRDSIRDWVSDRLIPRIEEEFREARFPMDLVGRWLTWDCSDPPSRKSMGAQGSEMLLTV